MTTETATTIPGMRADGLETEIEPSPIRPSGFASLVFGLLSILALLGRPLLLLPLLAFIFGLFALRPSPGGVKPLGRAPARVGLVLAAIFGAAGFFLPFFKGQVLGDQAAHFAGQFLNLVSAGEDEYAMQLIKSYVNRSVPEIPLRELYRREPAAVDAIAGFRDQEVIQVLHDAGPKAEWVPVAPPRLFTFQGFDRVELMMGERTERVSEEIEIVLEYRVDSKTQEGQWHVAFCDVYHEALVAKGAL